MRLPTLKGALMYGIHPRGGQRISTAQISYCKCYGRALSTREKLVEVYTRALVTFMLGTVALGRMDCENGLRACHLMYSILHTACLTCS